MTNTTKHLENATRKLSSPIAAGIFAKGPIGLKGSLLKAFHLQESEIRFSFPETRQHKAESLTRWIREILQDLRKGLGRDWAGPYQPHTTTRCYERDGVFYWQSIVFVSVSSLGLMERVIRESESESESENESEKEADTNELS